MEDFSRESENGSRRIANTAYHRVKGTIIEVVAVAVIAKLKERGYAADSGTGTAQVLNMALSGTGGIATITMNGLDFTLTFNTNLTTTASDFVTTNSAAFALFGITLTSSTNNLIFTAAVAGFPIEDGPILRAITGNMVGAVTQTTANGTNPLLMHNISGASLAAGEKVYAETEFYGIQLTSGTVMVR
jgi:hypothetical protein